jgi:ribosomal protein S18 acetylase RimI-like enzyme
MGDAGSPFLIVDGRLEQPIAMVVLQQITTGNVTAFKTARLRALQDSPSAFGSTYARESQFPDAEWTSRAANMNGEKRIGFLAMDDEVPCGIIAGFRDEDDPTRAQVVSMWVAPAYRRRGVGSALIAAVRDGARTRGVAELQLMVTSRNHTAIEFYERLGFSLTGKTEPYPNDPSLIEYQMSQLVPK